MFLLNLTNISQITRLRRLSSIKRIGFLLCLVVTLLITFSPAALAYTPEELSNRLEVKFRRVGSVYLQAVGHPVNNPADTTALTVAYRYPEQFLQVLRGAGQREQYVLLSEKKYALHYPHLNSYEEGEMTAAERRRLIADFFPLVGLIGAAVSEEHLEENVETTDFGDTLLVQINHGDPRLEFEKTEIVLDRSELRPLYLLSLASGESGDYRLEIVSYEEDLRFPKPVEQALAELDLRFLVGEEL